MKVSSLSPKSPMDPNDKLVLSAASDTNLVTVETLQALIGGGSGADTRSGSKLSSYATTVDNTSSSGMVYVSSTPVSNGTIASLAYKDLPFGLYSVIVRTWVESVGSSGDIFKIEALAGSASVASVTVTPAMVDRAKIWVSVGIGIDFKGTTGDQLTVSLKTVASPITPFKIDYVQVMPAPVAINAAV